MYPNLRAVMEQNRIRYLDLAPLLKISEGMLSLKLVGRYEFTPAEQARISEHLGLKTEWLFLPFKIPPEARLPPAPNAQIEHAVIGPAEIR